MNGEQRATDYIAFERTFESKIEQVAETARKLGLKVTKEVTFSGVIDESDGIFVGAINLKVEMKEPFVAKSRVGSGGEGGTEGMRKGEGEPN